MQAVAMTSFLWISTRYWFACRLSASARAVLVRAAVARVRARSSEGSCDDPAMASVLASGGPASRAESAAGPRPSARSTAFTARSRDSARTESSSVRRVRSASMSIATDISRSLRWSVPDSSNRLPTPRST